jgi:hypothetical protein
MIVFAGHAERALSQCHKLVSGDKLSLGSVFVKGTAYEQVLARLLQFHGDACNQALNLDFLL